jgi:hypothetical protein
VDARFTRLFKLLNKLFGKNTSKNVVIVTTRWDTVYEEEGEQRERELRENEVFKSLRGRLARHNNTLESAQRILRNIILNRSMIPPKVDDRNKRSDPFPFEEPADNGVVTIA